jgi:hypothetical protein
VNHLVALECWDCHFRYGALVVPSAVCQVNLQVQAVGGLIKAWDLLDLSSHGAPMGRLLCTGHMCSAFFEEGADISCAIYDIPDQAQSGQEPPSAPIS